MESMNTVGDGLPLINLTPNTITNIAKQMIINQYFTNYKLGNRPAIFACVVWWQNNGRGSWQPKKGANIEYQQQ